MLQDSKTTLLHNIQSPTFGLCLSDSVSYNLNDFTEQAAKSVPSGENVIEFTGYKSLLQDIKNHFDFQLWIILILQSSLRMSSRDIPETDRCVISC